MKLSEEDERTILRAVRTVMRESARADYETDKIQVSAYRVPLFGGTVYRVDIRLRSTSAE